jgi:hypothetical protein
VIGDSRRLRRWLIGVALAAVVVAGLGLWAMIAGGSWLLRQVPALAETAGTATAGLREQAEAWVPGIGRQLDAWLPAAAPASDVGGEDLADIARYPGLVRTAYAFGDGERRVVYRGPAEWRAVADYYARELTARGFAATVTSASATAETRVYRNGGREIEVRVAAAAALGGPVAELELRERGG